MTKAEKKEICIKKCKLIQIKLFAADSIVQGRFEFLSSNMRFFVMFVTAVCVLFLIKLRWPKKKNFYEKINSWVSFISLYGYGAPLGGPGAPPQQRNKKKSVSRKFCCYRYKCQSCRLIHASLTCMNSSQYFKAVLLCSDDSPMTAQVMSIIS